MNNLYWIGIRKSDLIFTENLFNGSITIFGDGLNGNIALCKKLTRRIDHNDNFNLIKDFYNYEALKIINSNKNAKFMFYNPLVAYTLDKEITERTLCLNSSNLLNMLENKQSCKAWLNNIVKSLDSAQLLGNEISMSKLNSIYPNCEDFVIQSPISSGGIGTYVINEANCNYIIAQLDKTSSYTVSKYYNNSISVNIHCIITEQTTTFYPLSIQIVANEANRILYKGCDFIAAKRLDDSLKANIKSISNRICKKLQSNNYRGVVGIDYLIVDRDVFFCEINPRFQASTSVLNIGLNKNNLVSIHEANICAFKELYHSQIEPWNLSISYSSYTYNKNAEYDDFHNHIQKCYFDEYPEFNELKDGYNLNCQADSGSYLFRAIYPYSIAMVKDSKVYVNEILSGYSLNEPFEPILLKIMLIIFGVRISDSALKYIQKNGKIREANFSAIDIILYDDLIVNCPYKNQFTNYSPFSIKICNGDIILFYFDKKISIIKMFYESKLNYSKTKNGVKFSSVAFLATDRLRVNYNPVCFFKTNSQSCKFCNLPNKNESYNFDDVKEIIESFLSLESFRHFLIGGGSNHPEYDYNNVIQLIKYLNTKTKKPLYLMSLPPKNSSVLESLFRLGVSEVAFNIEIFDQTLAEYYMPGKGKISRNHYFYMLEKAVSLWGREGCVRSMVILGLEPDESVLLGIERLCKIGVQPMLSIFRPMAFTELESYLSPSSTYIYNLYKKIEAICEKHGQTPGPSCAYCQNNTVSINKKYNKKKFRFQE